MELYCISTDKVIQMNTSIPREAVFRRRLFLTTGCDNSLYIIFSVVYFASARNLNSATVRSGKVNRMYLVE